MQFPLVTMTLWATGFIANVALVFVLIYKRRFRVVPWFTAYILWQVLYTLICFLTYRLALEEAYAIVYWVGALIDFMLQIAVLMEIARLVLRPCGFWVEGARAAVLPFIIAGPIVGGLLAAFIKPAAYDELSELAARASLFSTIVVCFSFIAIILASQILALNWRGHLAGESLGLTIWTLAAFVTDTLHAYWRTIAHFEGFENLRVFVFQLVLLYWCVTFWLAEPASPDVPAAALTIYADRLRE